MTTPRQPPWPCAACRKPIPPSRMMLRVHPEGTVDYICVACSEHAVIRRRLLDVDMPEMVDLEEPA